VAGAASPVAGAGVTGWAAGGPGHDAKGEGVGFGFGAGVSVSGVNSRAEAKRRSEPGPAVLTERGLG
jgi:hypothetical protein